MMISVTGASTVAFYRPPAVWRDALRSYRLVVDGLVVGKIRPGQVVRVPVSPGRHQVQAKIDWSGSPAIVIDIPTEAEARFRVEPSGKPLMALWQLLGTTTWLRLTFDGMSGPVPGVANSAESMD